MKKLLLIKKTDRTHEQVKEETCFESGIFKLKTPYALEGFKVEKDSHYYHVSEIRGDYNDAWDVKVSLLDDFNEYEEFSDELNNWEENIENKALSFHPEAKHIEINRNEIFTFDTHPYFIYVEYEIFDESYVNIGVKELNFMVLPNNHKYK